jgi:hypothetical protein
MSVIPFLINKAICAFIMTLRSTDEAELVPPKHRMEDWGGTTSACSASVEYYILNAQNISEMVLFEADQAMRQCSFSIRMTTSTMSAFANRYTLEIAPVFPLQ